MIQKKKKKKKKKKQREKNECFFDDDASKERSATTRTPQTNWRTSSFIDEMMRKDLCDDTKFSASLLSVFFILWSSSRTVFGNFSSFARESFSLL